MLTATPMLLASPTSRTDIFVSSSRLLSAPRFPTPLPLDRRNQPPSWLPTTAIRTTGWRAWATRRLPCRRPQPPGSSPGESSVCSRTASTESALRLPEPTYCTRQWDIKVRMCFLVKPRTWYSTHDRAVMLLCNCRNRCQSVTTPPLIDARRPYCLSRTLAKQV